MADALAGTALAPVAEEYLAEYADLPGGEASAVGQLMTDTMFRMPMVRWAGLRGDAPTWLCEFRWLHAGTGLAGHCADLPFAWDNLGADRVAQSCGPDAPQALADAMHGAWVEFISTHRAPWPTWTEGKVAMVYDTESTARPAYVLEQRLEAALAAG